MPQLLKILVLILIFSTTLFEQHAEANRRRRSGRGSRSSVRAHASSTRVRYTPIPATLDNSVTDAEEASGKIYKINPHLDLATQCSGTPAEMAGRLKPRDIKIFGVMSINAVLQEHQPIKIQACVVADNDRDAARLCSGGTRYSQKLYNILNPGNKQYSASARGDYNTNPDHYYYCIANSLNMIEVKQKVCTMAQEFYDNQLCSVPASRTSPTPPPTPAPTAALASPAPAPVTTSVAASDATDEDYDDVTDAEFDAEWDGFMDMLDSLPPNVRWNARHANGDGSCECDGSLDCPNLAQDLASRNQTDLDCMTAAGGCVRTPAAPAAAAPAAVAAAAAAAPPATTPEVLVQRCIDTEKQKADSCKSSVDQLEQTCAQTDESNRLVNGAAQTLTALGGASNASMAGQGVYATCVQSGAMALGASAALRTTQQRCTAAVGICDNCKNNQIQNFLDGCSHGAGFANFEALRTAKPELAQQLTSAHDTLTPIYEHTTAACASRVPDQQNSLGQLLNGLNNTAHASTSCACKTSSSGGSNCDTVPPVSVCVADPTAAGCQAYTPLATCAVGAPNYDAKTCGCVQNPTAAGCQQVAAAVAQSFSGNLAPGASISGFAGGTVTGGGGGGGGSGSSSNFSDLSGGGGGGTAVPANFANNIKQGEISTGGGATGGSVSAGGGGGGGSGGAQAAAGEKPKDEDKGIKGLFNNAKTFLTNAFGGSGARTTAQKSTGNGAIDASRFKPAGNLRGAAQQRDIASQNEKTLFELVNECANGLRCRSTTANTMMTGP